MGKRSSDVVSVGVGVFALVGVASQFVRPDLDWVRVPMSFYLLGPYGGWMRGAYFALAIALVAMGVGAYRAMLPSARSAAPLLLFCLGAIALAVTALADTGTSAFAPSLESIVHGIAASAAFLCTTTAMVLQSWRLRSDPSWRPRFAPLFALALFCFVALWMLVLRLPLPMPRGLGQKLLILAILAWLGMAAYWLRTSGLQQRAPTRDA